VFGNGDRFAVKTRIQEKGQIQKGRKQKWRGERQKRRGAVLKSQSGPSVGGVKITEEKNGVTQ